MSGKYIQGKCPLVLDGVWEWLTPVFAEHQLSTTDREQRGIPRTYLLGQPCLRRLAMRRSAVFYPGWFAAPTTCWRAFWSFSAATPRELRVTVDKQYAWLQNNQALSLLGMFTRSVRCAASLFSLRLPNLWKTELRDWLQWANCRSPSDKKLSCRREAAWCFAAALNISLSHPRSLKVIGNSTIR